MSYNITISPDSIARLKNDFYLMDREVPVVISRVINRTLTAVNTEASIQVRKVYNLKSARVKKNFKIFKTTKDSLNGRWRSEGRPVGLLQFGARQNKRGVSVKVMTAGARTTVIGAFIQIPKWDSSRNRAIVSGPQVFWRDKVNGKRVDRYNINRLDGPRIEDALSKPEVQRALQEKADTTLAARLDAEANYILSKAK